MLLPDNNGEVMNCFKQIVKGCAQDILKGKFPELVNMSAVAQIHAPYSYLSTACNDLAMCGFHLRAAA
jgi:hypothetical protein